MTRKFLIIFTFLSAFSLNSLAIRHVGNGGGFSEYLLVKSLNEVTNRWDLNATGLSCLTQNQKHILRNLSEVEKKYRSSLIFLDKSEYSTKKNQPSNIVSPSYPYFLSGPLKENIYVNHESVLNFVSDLKINDLLLESALLRDAVATKDQLEIRNCVQSAGKDSFITTDLRTYRQYKVGVVLQNNGELNLFSNDLLYDILDLKCSLDLANVKLKTASISGAGNQLTWVISVALPSECKNGSTEIYSRFDFEIQDGTYEDFLSGQPKISLKLKNSKFFNN